MSVACDEQKPREVLPAVAPGAPNGAPTAADVLTFQYDEARRGLQARETVLDPSSVSSPRFGKRFSFDVDGYVYAQPLYVARLLVGGTQREVLFVATEHNSVYAFDAAGAIRTPLWHVSLLGPGETTVPADDVGTDNITPEIGITGTPVIDRALGILYVVAKSKRVDGEKPVYIQRVHALRLSDGGEVAGGPVEIDPIFRGSAPDAVEGLIPFNARRENQRAALVLAKGRVWITWAAHGDFPPYHGWVLGYDGAALDKPPIAWMTTPSGSAGGIWMSANGPSIDEDGHMYVASGNGDFGLHNGAMNYGTSAVKLRIDETGELHVVDSFTPHDEEDLSERDQDFGTSSVMLLPPQSGPVRRLGVAAGKQGLLYLLNLEGMGGHRRDEDDVLQVLRVAPKLLISSPVFFDNTLYVCPFRQPLRAYPFDPVAQRFATEPSSESVICPTCYRYGATPSVSANGTSNAIVWTLDITAFEEPGPAILHAHDARDVSRELWNSAGKAEDEAPLAVKFTTPMIVNGRVYVGGQRSVAAFGLAP